MDKQLFKEVYFEISQSCIGYITDSVLYISFSFNVKLKIDIFIMKNVIYQEELITNSLKKNMETRLSKFEVEIFLHKISISDFVNFNYGLLDYGVFLRNRENLDI